SAAELRGGQPTTDKRRNTLVAGVAVEVCARNLEDLGLAASIALRRDVVKNAVVTAADLVDSRGRENVRFGKGDIPTVVDDSLRAAKRIGFRKTGRVGAAGDSGEGLVVAEAGEQAVGGGEVVIQANVKFGFIELPHGLVDEVVGTVVREARSRKREKIDHLLGDRIDQPRRNLVARRPRYLTSVCVQGRGVAGAIALEIDICGSARIRRGACAVQSSHVWVVNSA